MPRKRVSHKPVFSCNSIGAPSNCKNEFAGAAVTAVSGALDGAVIAAVDGALVVTAVAALEVEAAAGFTTTGLAATAPAVVSLCAQTVEPAINDKPSPILKIRSKVRLCMAADLFKDIRDCIIKG